MRRFTCALVSFSFLFLAGVSAAEPDKPRITDIGGTIHGKEARVTFTLRNAFPPEMVEALKSGIEISFKSYVRVERVYHGWFNVDMGEERITRSVRYDALSRVYRLHADKGEELLPDIFSALERMTRYEVLIPLDLEAERGKSYRAYVRTRLDRVGLSDPLRSIFFFSSLWDVETEWARGYLVSK